MGSDSGSDQGYLDRRGGPANVLGMKLSFTKSHTELRQFVQVVNETFRVTKVQRSASGFRTTTGTRWTCRHCREEARDSTEGLSDAGVEPYPMAVWKFTGVSNDPTWAFLYLCAQHFRKRRDGQQEPPQELMTIGEIFNEAFDDVADPQSDTWITSRPRA
ncbi:hypothetical protein LCGC14_1334030 [marine sediment metagenome]|uniref:Uncharacterized protein n=1 Tax=marine sediment metagenome TaxID=412755 RepID=A0A0F9NI64_9ZZZZ